MSTDGSPIRPRRDQQIPSSTTVIVGPGIPDPIIEPPHPAEHAHRPDQTHPPHHAHRPADDRHLARALHAEARREEPTEVERTSKRLILVLILTILAVPGLILALAMLKIELPPAMIILLVGLVAFGGIASAASIDPPKPKRRANEDEGSPVGCCPGPRPLRSFRK
ncbi:MAG: hypothetical protein ACF8SC_07005 [Phycisphaerales bacterium JB037]